MIPSWISRQKIRNHVKANDLLAKKMNFDYFFNGSDALCMDVCIYACKSYFPSTTKLKMH